MADIAVKRDVVVEHTGFRLSWGAIFAGFIVATMLQIVLALLGVAVGFTTWDPGDPARDLGMGMGIWLAISALVSLFVGGLTTGRLAGVLTRGDGAIHGVVMWGLATLFGLWLAFSGAGFLLGGAFSIVGRTVAATTGAVASGVTQLGQAAVGQAGDVDPGALQREIEAALAQTGDPALSADTLAGRAGEVRELAASGASNTELAREIAGMVRSSAGRVDREAIVNVVTARTDMSRPEAERVATRIESVAGSVRAQAAAGVETARETAGDVAATASDYVGRAAWWALLALGLGVTAAAVGAGMTARE